MKDISRRRLLAVGLLGRTAMLAGCLERPTQEHTPDASGHDDLEGTGDHPVASREAGSLSAADTDSKVDRPNDERASDGRRRR